MSAAMYPWVPEWLRILLTLALLGLGLIVGVAALRAALIVAEVVSVAAWKGAQRLTVWLSDLLIRLVLGSGVVLAAALLTTARVCGRAAARLCARAFAPIALWFESMRQREKLRLLWEEEYRDQFPRFEDFLEAFARGGKPREEERQEPPFDEAPRAKPPPKRDPPRPRPSPPPPPDPKRLAFAAACRLMGVPESGEFTPQFLNVRYRALISAAHPDRGGNAQRAAAINAARDLIKTRKGWT
ncbi:hypothetical protein [Hydrogenophaga sp. H7]|uniref:hypothetical protein n=1 Tax=Hydrogenophaga sp. H7 TaxID=1882399 RepID=UPI0009A267E4|nr:hypothetical protein [Hydrogenophaga sp. H7]